MCNLSGKLNWRTAVLLMSCLMLLSGLAAADTFVSYGGKFHFSYPEEWVQVDYNTAAYYLSRGDDENQVDFEAVFSEKANFIIFQGQYLILTIDTLGPILPEKVDSLLDNLADDFGRPIKEVSSEEFLSRTMGDTIAFDRINNLVGVETEVGGGDAGPRVNLLVMKLYEHGIANFYFYAPQVEFAASLPTYRDMAMSFSTEAVAKADPEDVRVADLDDDSNIGGSVVMFAGLAIILIVIIAARRKSRAKKQ